MKTALFSSVPYLGPAVRGAWPVPVTTYSHDAARHSVEFAMDQYQLADDLGFDWVTVAEHHFAPFSLTPNPMLMAAALTQRIKRARIALLGANIPILNPVRVAEEFAMLDSVTNGRVIAGMLRGTTNEYVTYNVNPAESRERFEEALKLIVRAWTEPQPFGWQGRYYEYRTISIWPRPVQQPHPPIYMSGSSPESAELAARLRVHLGFAVTTVPLAAKSAAVYRAAAAAAGWEPSPEHVLYRVAAHVADTDEEALSDLGGGPHEAAGRASFTLGNKALDDAAARAGYYGRETVEQRSRLQSRPLAERIELGSILAGSPDTVLRQALAIREALGAGVLELVFAPTSREKTLHAIELFGTRVLPRLRDA
jgi:alkanesulfonate monooxygenase SsuD/methylene tetrahydromethanopterin reductase-like flavin-dependent oxidoreductase (luciferase family)